MWTDRHHVASRPVSVRFLSVTRRRASRDRPSGAIFGTRKVAVLGGGNRVFPRDCNIPPPALSRASTVALCSPIIKGRHSSRLLRADI